MGDVETEHPDQNQKKTKCAEKFDKVKFPITIEPLVCLYTISVGLNEVIIWIYMFVSNNCDIHNVYNFPAYFLEKFLTS